MQRARAAGRGAGRHAVAAIDVELLPQAPIGAGSADVQEDGELRGAARSGTTGQPGARATLLALSSYSRPSAISSQCPIDSHGVGRPASPIDTPTFRIWPFQGTRRSWIVVRML